VLPRRVLCDDDRAREVDERLRTLLVEQLAGHRISDGTLAEVRTPLWDAAAKHSLHLRSGAVAADMESGAVAEVAAEMRVPFVVVRAIVDGATREIPACARRALDGDGSVRASTLLVGVVRRPWEIVALLRLARDFNAAHRTLAAAAVALRGAAEAFGRW